MVKLSVIIPVYNTENYLTECIESVLNQIYPEKPEIILVDDGSTDLSPDICDYYADLDNHIKVIHKENRGLSSARNAGIDAADGDYIAFLDSCDFWIDNTIHDFLKIADETQADIIIGNAIRYMDTERRFSQYQNNLKYNPLYRTTEEKLKYILNPVNRFQWHIWKCIYKADIIKKNRIYFNENIEDFEWMPRVLSMAENIEIIEKIFVCCREKKDDSVENETEKSIKRQRDMLNALYNLTAHFSKISMDRNLKHYFYANFAEYYLYVFMRQALLQDRYSKSLLKKMSPYICFYQGKYSKPLKFIYNILGYRNTCRIINLTGKAALFAKSLK